MAQHTLVYGEINYDTKITALMKYIKICKSVCVDQVTGYVFRSPPTRSVLLK